MSLSDDLRSDVANIYSRQWKKTPGRKVPTAEEVQLGNHAVLLEGTVLYADLVGSTEMVLKKKNWFAAEIYKSYLHCAAKIIRRYNGVITSYDGDRVMAVFIGDFKNSNAVRAGLGIYWAMDKLVNPLAKSEYADHTTTYRHCVGVDAGGLFAARTGIRGSNDLVWIGRSPNYAAKLSDLRDGNWRTWITKAVHDKLSDDAKYSRKDGKNMWDRRTWIATGLTIYGSTWMREP